MGNMRFKVGDRVRIKSLDWYNKNKDGIGEIQLYKPHCLFAQDMSIYCNKIMTIKEICYGTYYRMKEDVWGYSWTDEMIEGLVEEETNDCEKCGLTRNSTRCLFMDNCPNNKQKNIIEVPEDYVLKDENGNVINARKVVLEKKKKEYPKTYEECLKVLGYDDREIYCVCYTCANERLFESLYRLKVCRDAYWKIAGEEMGLGKPWEPSDSDYITGRYCIFVHRGNIICDTPAQDCILTFPTEEMRDAFKENFGPDIEFCKEFL